MQDGLAVGVVDRVDDRDRRAAFDDELALIARLSAALRVEDRAVERDAARRRRRRPSPASRAGRRRRGTGSRSSDEHLGSAALRLEPCGDRQVLLAQEGRVEQLRGVARAGIAKKRHDRVARPELARKPDRAGDVDPRRAAEQQALLDDEVEDDRQRLLVGDLVGDVDRRAFEIGGDAALADALGDRGARGS